MKALVLLVQVSLLLSVQAAAQDVFVTRGAGSPVYSDRPQPGARPLTLPELNVSQPVPIPKAALPAATRAPEGPPAAPVPAYRKFSIVAPANDGSVAANTALFEVRVAVEPDLQLGEGHAITVTINGRPVGQRFTASEFMIPPEFWGDTLPPVNQRYQLDAAIVDGNGAVLRQAEPVTFHLRHVAGLQQRPWHRPLAMPLNKPSPPKNPTPRRFEGM